MTELKVLVVGDLMLDVYLWGHASRISPEAPVMVVEVERETSVPGGAANVVHNLAALGARVRVLGVIGDDAPGEQLRNALREQGADTEGLVVDAGRPTTVKSRVMSHHRQVMRIDRENKQPISPAAEAEICQQIEAFGPQHDVILISDYAKGLVTPRIARTATAQREQGCFGTWSPSTKLKQSKWRARLASPWSPMFASTAPNCDLYWMSARWSSRKADGE